MCRCRSLAGTQADPTVPCISEQMPHLFLGDGTPLNRRLPAVRQQQQKQRAVVVSLATLCCLAAVGVVSRLLLRRRRRQLIRQALDQQALLQQEQGRSGSARSGGSAAEGGSASCAVPPASMVRRTQRGRLTSLLSAAIGHNRSLQMIPLEHGGLVHELGHGAVQHAADSLPQPSDTAGRAARKPGSGQPPPSVELTSWLQQSRDAAIAAAHGWQWGLPTESLRVPASSLEVRAAGYLWLLCHKPTGTTACCAQLPAYLPLHLLQAAVLARCCRG